MIKLDGLIKVISKWNWEPEIDYYSGYKEYIQFLKDRVSIFLKEVDMIKLENLIGPTFRWDWDSRIDTYERGIIIGYPSLKETEISHLYYFPKINNNDYNVVKIMGGYETKYALIDEESFTDDEVLEFLGYIHRNEEDLVPNLSTSDYQRREITKWIDGEVMKDLEEFGAEHNYFNALRDKKLVCRYGFQDNGNFYFDKEADTLYQYICVPLPTGKAFFIRLSINGILGYNIIDYGSKNEIDFTRDWKCFTDLGEFKKKVEGEILVEQLNCVNQHIEFTSWMNRVTKGLNMQG